MDSMDTRMRIGLFGLLIVIVTAGGGLFLLGGSSDGDVRTADDLDWVCDKVVVDVGPVGEPADTPEAAITQTVSGAELVEAYSSDDEVLFAYNDADGETIQSHRVVRDDDGWVTTEIQSCQD